jgi:hypothetical protein
VRRAGEQRQHPFICQQAARRCLVAGQRASRTACDVKSPGASNELQQRRAPVANWAAWPWQVSARRRTVVQRLPCAALSMQRGWTGMLRPGARWGRAAEAVARGSAVRGAAATIARRRRLEVAPRMRVSLPKPQASRVCQQGPFGQLGRCCAAGPGSNRCSLPGPAKALGAVQAGARDQPQHR